MLDSRVLSARAVGQAIAAAERPSRVWLQMSTATIYAHRFDAANDEATGQIGGAEPGVPGYWAFSVDLAKAWEREQQAAETPHTARLTPSGSRRRNTPGRAACSRPPWQGGQSGIRPSAN
jgi:uncharacterized protein